MGVWGEGRKSALVVIIGAAGCAVPGSSETGYLPAYETEAEKQNYKGWEWVADGDPLRAPTAPPAGAVTLPGEYEALQELIVAIPAVDESPTLRELVAATSRTQATTVLVPDATVQANLSDSLPGLGADMTRVTFTEMPVDGIWVRDYGPIAVYDQTQARRFIDFKYYTGREIDDAVPTLLAQSRGLSVHRPPLYLEGGNLQSDGQGLCITSEVVLEANEGATPDSVQSTLASYAGCQTTVILPPIVGDGTGHVDMFAHLYGPRKALLAEISASDDPQNAAAMNEAARRLQAAGVAVTRIPMGSGYRDAEYVYYRTYTNAVAIAGAVIVPVYREDSRGRDQALAAFAQAYPGRNIIPIEADDLLDRAGALHCVTMQIPAQSRAPGGPPPPTTPVPSSPPLPPVGDGAVAGAPVGGTPGVLGCQSGPPSTAGAWLVCWLIGVARRKKPALKSR